MDNITIDQLMQSIGELYVKHWLSEKVNQALREKLLQLMQEENNKEATDGNEDTKESS